MCYTSVDKENFMTQIFEQYIHPFLVTIGKTFTLEWIFWGAVIIEVALIIYFLARSFFAYELKLFRKIDSLNLWLLENNQINEENLIEFNNRMKRVPKILRYQWQQYMLYRDKTPSHYMSVHNCVENPIKSSKLTTNIKSITAISFMVAAVAFLLSAGALEGNGDDAFVMLFKASITPLLVLVLNTFYTSLLKVRQSNIQVDLFETFHIFERLMDRASTTIPQYVDFEVLFTRQEIKKGIPVLNEYLEKRAREEEIELEKARINAVEHIQYDFDAVGMDGALLLERAMRECEIYTNLRARLMLEIGQIESEIESYKKSYENTQKDYQKKLQASKENIDRLRTQQETTTNRIESNYIRKQQTDEIKKQQQVEKDFDDATIRYKQEVSTISQEVAKRKAELEEKREYIETVMLQEFKTYSGKVFAKLEEQAASKTQKVLEDLNAVNKRITKELEETNDSLIKKSSEAEIARSEAVRFSQALVQANEKISDIINKKHKHGSASAEQVTVAGGTTTEAEGYYDERGYYIFPNGTYYDNHGNFYDGSGGYYDATGVYHGADEQVVVSEPVAKEIANKEQPAEVMQESAVQQPEIIEPEQLPEVQEVPEVQEPEQPVLPIAEAPAEAEKEGSYDERGYFIYPDGSYYDDRGYFIYPDGTYYDDKGNFYDADGGYYDADGNYHPADKAFANEPEVPAQPAELEKPATAEVKEPKPIAQTIVQKPEPQAIAQQQKEAEKPQAEAPEDEETAEKKGRGRPKKETTQVVEETGEKKGRGRPKKEVTEEDAPQTEKKGRGRPKKEVTEEEVAPTEKKGRGRPKKLDTSNTEALKAEMDALASEAEALLKAGGNEDRLRAINNRLSELVLLMEKEEQ